MEGALSLTVLFLQMFQFLQVNIFQKQIGILMETIFLIPTQIMMENWMQNASPTPDSIMELTTIHKGA